MLHFVLHVLLCMFSGRVMREKEEDERVNNRISCDRSGAHEHHLLSRVKPFFMQHFSAETRERGKH